MEDLNEKEQAAYDTVITMINWYIDSNGDQLEMINAVDKLVDEIRKAEETEIHTFRQAYTINNYQDCWESLSEWLHLHSNEKINTSSLLSVMALTKQVMVINQKEKKDGKA